MRCGKYENEKNQRIKWLKNAINQDRKNNKVESFFELDNGFNLGYGELLLFSFFVFWDTWMHVFYRPETQQMKPFYPMYLQIIEDLEVEEIA